MKKLLIPTLILAFAINSYSQTTSTTSKSSTMDSTTVTLKGTYINDGKVYLKDGYKISYSKDKTVGTIRRISNGAVSGTFGCDCLQDGKNCYLITGKNTIGCSGETCCGLVVTTSSDDLTTISGTHEGIQWKRLIIPTTTIKSSSN